MVDLLEEWLAADHGANVAREITSSDLWKELRFLAQRSGTDFSYKTAKGFAQRLRNLKTTLRQQFDIRERTGRANKRFLSFTLKEQGSEKGSEQDAGFAETLNLALGG